MSKNLCRCGNNRRNHEPCENCSQYKLVFLLRDVSSPLKITDGAGRKVNPAIWSFLKEDKRPVQKVISGMMARAKKFQAYRHSRFIAFYHRQHGLIEKLQP